VIGGGVIGLTTALELARDGWDVEVVSAEPVGSTTSAVAAAVWFPYLVGPADAVERWGAATADELARLAGDPSVPVTARTLHEFLRAPAPAAWRETMPDFADEDLVPDWAVLGWRYTSWTVDMPRYLQWLADRLEERGVVPDVARVASTAEVHGPSVDVVVDCAGIGAARLADDDTLVPVRGQVVLVDAPDVTDVWLDPDGPGGATYVIPRTDAVVCGGTADRGVWDRTPDDAVTADIVARAAALVPAIADAPVLDVQVGLRPSRPEVRLELEATTAGPVLHHYGHGGAGVTLSWGSARAARDLVRTLVE
jgi:D-amino-acid oxidase